MISDHDYNVLSQFGEMILRRLEQRKMSRVEAQEDLLHPLTAWADGHEDGPEFVPYMKLRLAAWKQEEA